MTGARRGWPLFAPVVVRRSTGRPANGPLVTCPPLVGKSVMSAFVMAANAARGSGSFMEPSYRPRPAEPSAGVRSARYGAGQSANPADLRLLPKGGRGHGLRMTDDDRRNWHPRGRKAECVLPLRGVQ